jgi:DUF4097 and DUF4098 domain-containing protein YvlB
MKVLARLIPLTLLACGGDDPIVLDLDTDAEPLPASMDFESDAVSRLVVETVNGTVDLQPGGSDGGVSVNLVRAEPDETWDYFLQDKVLAMWPLCDNGVIGCSSGFALGAPSTMRADIKTVSGTVTLTDYTGEVIVENTQGLVNGVRLSGGELTVSGNSATFNIEYTGEPGIITLTTVDGAINLDVPRGTYALDVNTNGVKSITDLMDGDGPVIIISSTSGDVTVRGI